MKPIKQIVVPTDFSDTAHNALHTALIIAHKLGARITLAHFYYQTMPLDSLGQPLFVPSEKDWEALRQGAEENMAKLKHQASLSFPDVKLRTKNQIGDVPDQLPQLCEEENADMIVCGTNGTDKIGELIWGTNTTAIVNHVHIPVLVVPGKASLTKLHKIVFATDFQFEDVKVITELAAGLKAFFPLIQVVHMSEAHPQDNETLEWLQEVTEKRAHYPHITFHHLKGQPSFHLLEDYLHKQKADLLVLTTKGKNIFERVVSGSLSREMLCHSQVPMLVYHIHPHHIG